MTKASRRMILPCLVSIVFALGRLEADRGDGILSSESELFFCGYLIGEIGSVELSVISASMAMFIIVDSGHGVLENCYR